MTLENTLQVPVILQSVQLQARYRRSDSAPAEPTEGGAWSPAPTTAGRAADAPFTTDVLEQVVLNPGERTQVAFALTPRREGAVDLLGFTYLLSGVIRGRQLFATPEPDPALSLIVTTAMPRLVVQMALPPKLALLSGEVATASVVLSNQGAAPLTGLRVVLQHPHILAFGRPADGPLFTGTAAEGVVVTRMADADNALFDPAVQVLALAAPLQPGESLTLPLWIRSNNPGQVASALLFHYTSKVLPALTRTRRVAHGDTHLSCVCMRARGWWLRPRSMPWGRVCSGMCCS
jgi:hypothetical protein